MSVSTAPVSVIVPSYGPPGSHYAAFVPRFWQAITAMNPRPAEVVVVHTDPEPLGILAAAPLGIATRGVLSSGTHSMHALCNRGAAAACHPWVSCVGVDDCYRPDAMVDIRSADASGAEILIWDHHDGECRRHGQWNPINLLRANTVHGSCPFRKSLWRRVGGFPPVAWSDWGFWIRCAQVNALVYQSDRIGIDWDRGEGRDTLTQQASACGILHSRNAEIHAFIQEMMS